jgi:hypothetical protein
MKRIQIIKNNRVTNQAEMPEAEALAWLEQGKAEHWFGAPAVFESRYNEEAGEMEQVEVTPAEEFEVVIEDITQELADKEAARVAKEQRVNAAKSALALFKANPNSANSVAALRTQVLNILELLED